MKPIAIIPARGGSKRIKRKNIIDVCEKPMLAWPITMALETDLFSRVIVSTEDEEIASIAKQYGAQSISRPDELATDTAAEIDAYAQVLNVVEQEENVIPEFFCAIYPTAILLQPDDIKQSFARFDSGADVVMGVSEYPIHPFKALEEGDDGFLKMLHPYECNELRSQDYPHYVASNGTFYWFRTKPFLDAPDYFPKKLNGHIVARDRAVDIDVPDDLTLAKILKREQLNA